MTKPAKKSLTIDEISVDDDRDNHTHIESVSNFDAEDRTRIEISNPQFQDDDKTRIESPIAPIAEMESLPVLDQGPARSFVDRIPKRLRTLAFPILSIIAGVLFVSGIFMYFQSSPATPHQVVEPSLENTQIPDPAAITSTQPQNLANPKPPKNESIVTPTPILKKPIVVSLATGNALVFQGDKKVIKKSKKIKNPRSLSKVKPKTKTFDPFAESLLFKKLLPLQKRYKQSKNLSKRRAIALYASRLTDEHYNKIEKSKRSIWQSSRKLTSPDARQRSRKMVLQIRAIKRRASQAKTLLPAFLSGHIKDFPKSSQKK